MDTKLWWQSRTIWVQLVAFLFAMLAMLGWLPADLTQEQVVTAIMAVVAVLTALLRILTTKKIVPPALPPAGPGTGAAAALMLAIVALPALLAGCTPPQSAGDIVVKAGPTLDQVQRDYTLAKAVADILAPSLPSKRQAQIRAIEGVIEKALGDARLAATIAQQISQLKRAQAAVDQLNASTSA